MRVNFFDYCIRVDTFARSEDYDFKFLGHFFKKLLCIWANIDTSLNGIWRFFKVYADNAIGGDV